MSTIDIVQAPAVEVAAPMNGVTVDQANAPKFQEAFIEGVAAQMDVKPDQVVVTDVAYGEVAQGPAPVIVTFQIRDIDQDDQLDMTKAAATDDMAGAIQVLYGRPEPYYCRPEPYFFRLALSYCAAQRRVSPASLLHPFTPSPLNGRTPWRTPATTPPRRPPTRP